MAFPKKAESNQFAPGESAERNTDTARGPVVEDSAKEELALRPFEGVKEQHDEYQRIVFVLVYADEKRYARLDPRAKIYRTAGNSQACRRKCAVSFSASPTATVTSCSVRARLRANTLTILLQLGRRTTAWPMADT